MMPEVVKIRVLDGINLTLITGQIVGIIMMFAQDLLWVIFVLVLFITMLVRIKNTVDKVEDELRFLEIRATPYLVYDPSFDSLYGSQDDTRMVDMEGSMEEKM